LYDCWLLGELMPEVKNLGVYPTSSRCTSTRHRPPL
jgi:hypothetical protein